MICSLLGMDMLPNQALQRTRINRAAELGRVCQAWRRTSEGKVLAPGSQGAEGEEPGKRLPRT